MKPRHAFTVIELLVVIGIITLLAVLAVPVWKRMREQSRSACCNCNLKQIGLACAQYSADNADRIPWGKTSVFQNLALMSNQLGSPYILVCSSPKKPAKRFNDPNATDTLNVSYTQQAALSTGMIFQANADEVLFWDQGVAGNPCGPTGDIGLNWAKTSNHKGTGGNVLFNDGHVEWQTKTPTNMPLGCLNP